MIELRPGSSLYYSLLWIEPDQRQRLINRLSLITALTRTLDDVQEPTVAEQKIHWWHEELDRMHSGAARHPAVQACQRELANNKSGQNACLQILSAVSTLRFTPAATETEAKTLITNDYQPRLALLSHALTQRGSELVIDSHPEITALTFGLHEQLSRLPKLIHRGLPVFSNEVYKKFNTSPHELAKHVRVAADANHPDPGSLSSIPINVESPGRSALINFAIDQARSTADEAVSSNSVGQRYRKADLLPVWRLLILRQQQLKLWQKRKPDLLRQRITLTPIAKFYRAWLHRR